MPFKSPSIITSHALSKYPIGPVVNDVLVPFRRNMHEGFHVSPPRESKWKLQAQCKPCSRRDDGGGGLSVSPCRKARGTNSHHRQSAVYSVLYVVSSGVREMQSCQNRRYTTSSRTLCACRRSRRLRRNRKREPTETVAPFFRSREGA